MSSIFRSSMNQKTEGKSLFSATSRSKSPARQSLPNKEDMEKVTAWQNEMDSLEQTQMQIQADQMNLLHSQIHILTRELGDVQKQIAALTQRVDDGQIDTNNKIESLRIDLNTATDEAHAALRLELAEHGANAEEMKKAWEDAHNALSSAMDENLSSLAEQHAKDLEAHATNHAASVSDIEAALRNELQNARDDHAQMVRGLADEHDGKHADHASNLEMGLQNVLESTHGKLQAELEELRSGHAANLKDILADVTQQVDTLTLSMEQESALRKGLQEKLEKMFSGMRGVFTDSKFSDDGTATASIAVKKSSWR